MHSFCLVSSFLYDVKVFAPMQKLSHQKHTVMLMQISAESETKSSSLGRSQVFSHLLWTDNYGCTNLFHAVNVFGALCFCQFGGAQ